MIAAPPSAVARSADVLPPPAADGAPVRRLGFFFAPRHDQVLRNQRVGTRCSAAGAGPRFAAVMRAAIVSGDAVLAPAVRTRARMIVREVVPGGAAGAVVLAHRAPRALADVRSPCAPRGSVRS